MGHQIHTAKKPGDIVVDDDETYIIDSAGRQVPYEMPHRRAQRELAEAAAARRQAARNENSPGCRSFFGFRF